MEVINFSADNIIPESEVEQLLNGTESASDSSSNDTTSSDESNESNVSTSAEEDNNENKTVSAEGLTFDDKLEFPESVGGEEDNDISQNQDDGENSSELEDNTSPKQNFYSSITNALAEDGVFSNLDDDALSNIETPEDFSALIDEEISRRMDERQRRIEMALNNNVPSTEIQAYEQTLNGLSQITNDVLDAETEQGETIRKNLIYQDYVNKGFTPERATKEVQKSLNAGTDIEDAKECLQSCIDFYNNQYQQLLTNAENEKQQEQQAIQDRAKNIETSIMNDKDLLGGLEIDNNTRKRTISNISKAAYRDNETGEYLTELQKYQRENEDAFIKNVGLIFTLTNGFKDFDKFVQSKVKKEVKKGIRNLENVINSTSRGSDGLLKFAGQYAKEDPNSFIGKGWKLNI